MVLLDFFLSYALLLLSAGVHEIIVIQDGYLLNSELLRFVRMFNIGTFFIVNLDILGKCIWLEGVCWCLQLHMLKLINLSQYGLLSLFYHLQLFIWNWVRGCDIVIHGTRLNHFFFIRNIWLFNLRNCINMDIFILVSVGSASRRGSLVNMRIDNTRSDLIFFMLHRQLAIHRNLLWVLKVVTKVTV